MGIWTERLPSGNLGGLHYCWRGAAHSRVCVCGNRVPRAHAALECALVPLALPRARRPRGGARPHGPTAPSFLTCQRLLAKPPVPSRRPAAHPASLSGRGGGGEAAHPRRTGRRREGARPREMAFLVRCYANCLQPWSSKVSTSRPRAARGARAEARPGRGRADADSAPTR